MKSNARYLSLYLTALAGFITTGCGESLSNAELMSTLQMQTEPCTATFNQDHEVIDFWGDSLFTVKSGETYILADLYESGTTTEASFYYLVEEGAYGFELEVEGSDVSEFPFDLSCTNGTSSVLGVFSDVVVYSDEGLNEEVCRMNRGSSAPVDSVSGYSLVSGLFEFLKCFIAYPTGHLFFFLNWIHVPPAITVFTLVFLRCFCRPTSHSLIHHLKFFSLLCDISIGF